MNQLSFLATKNGKEVRGDQSKQRSHLPQRMQRLCRGQCREWCLVGGEKGVWADVGNASWALTRYWGTQVRHGVRQSDPEQSEIWK
jgi:hypothetical protein